MNAFYKNQLSNKGFTLEEIEALNINYFKKCKASELAIIIDEEKDFVYLVEDMIKVKVYDYEVYTDTVIAYNLFDQDEFLYEFNLPAKEQTIIQDMFEGKEEISVSQGEKVIKIIGALINELFR